MINHSLVIPINKSISNSLIDPPLKSFMELAEGPPITRFYSIARYSKLLEESTFHGRRADYLWLVLVCSGLLLVLSPLSPSPFLASSLSFTLVYLWARLNPTIRLTLWGLVTITAPYLPFALVIFSWTLSPWSGFIGDILGIFVGHIWYFFNYIWIREDASGKRNWLATPSILVRLLDEPRT